MDAATLELLRAGGSVAPPDDATRAAREIQLAQGNPLPVVTKTPQEEAQIQSEVNAPTNLAAIDAEIARTAHPIGRAVLQEERARVAAAQAPPKPPPTWDEVIKLPEIQALPFEHREAARNQYFLDVVAPEVPTEQLDAARAAFDADTKPSLLNQAIERISNLLPKKPAAPNVGELDSAPDLPVSEAEAKAKRAALEQPARMTMTRTGEPVLQGGRIVPPAELGPGDETAPILESVKAVPKLFQLGAVQAIPQMARQYQDLDQTVQEATAARDALQKRVDAKEPYTPPDYNQRLLAHSGDTPFSPEEELHQKRVLYTPPDSLGSYETEIKGLDHVIKIATEHRDHYAKISELVGKDIQAATPKDQGIGGKMVTTAAQSAPWMVLGVATRSPKLGAVPGTMVQGAQAFEQTMNAGEDARKRLPEFVAAHDKLKYIQDIAANEDADDTTRKAAANALEAMKASAEVRRAGTLSSAAEAQENAKAIEQFGHDLKFIGDHATVRNAKLNAGIQAVAEYAGEEIGLGAIMKPGSKLAPKLAESLATNFGQEFVTQGMQSLSQYAIYDPTMTVRDALEQMFIAGGAGAVTAGPLTVGSHVLEKAIDFASRPRQSAPGRAAAPASGEEVPTGELPTVGELLSGERVPAREAPPPFEEQKPEAAARIAEINGQLGMVATSLSKAREDGDQQQIDHYQARATELIGERAGLEKQANPDVAAEDLQRQNRDRTRAASVAQVQSIANKPDYDRLATAPIPDVGAPMVSVKGDTEAIPTTDMGKASVVTLGDGTKVPVRYAVVEADSVLASNDVNGKRNAEYFGNDIPAGQVVAMTNGRVAGVQGAYARDTAAPYKAGMLADPEHGVSAEAINGKKNPMLVRIYPDSYNALPRLAQLSNTGGSAQLSDTEKARGDAAALDSLDGFVPTESGDVTSAANMPFVRRFMQSIPENERPEMMTATGQLSQAGIKRLRAAVFAKAYGGGEVLARMIESSDDNVRSITAGLMRAAPAVARLREKVAAGALHDLDITPALLAAIEDISRLRDSGTSVGAWIAQADMFGALPREVGDLMQFLEDNARSGRRIADFLERYLAAAEAIGSPQQAGMFEQKVPSKADVVRGVTKEMANERQTGLPQGAQPAATDAGTAARGAAETGAKPVPGPLEPVQPGQKREGGARAEVGAAVTKQEFASTQVPLPAGLSASLKQIAKRLIAPEDLTPEDGLEDRPHITVKFGLHTPDVAAVRKVVSGEGPIQAKVAGIEIFSPEGKDYDVVVQRVSSPDLVRLNKAIAKAVPNTDTHPVYRPHITLGYVKKGTGKKYADAKTGLEGQTITLDTLEVSDKNEGVTPIKLGAGGLTVEQRNGKWWVSDTAGDLAEFDTEPQARRFAASMAARTPTVDVMQQAIDKVGEARFQELVAQHMEQFAGQKLEPGDEAHQVETVARDIIGNVDPLQEELDQALSDLGGWVEANLLPKAAMLPDNADENLLPILSRLFTVAIKMGYRDFAAASKYVMAQIRKKAAHLAALLNDAILRKAFDHATQTGQQPEGNQREHLGVPPRPDLLEDQGQIRKETGGQASRGGGALERAQADANRVVQPSSDGGAGNKVGKKTGLLPKDKLTVDGHKATVISTDEGAGTVFVRIQDGGARNVKAAEVVQDFSDGKYPPDINAAAIKAEKIEATNLIQTPERIALRKTVAKETAKRGLRLKDGKNVTVRNDKQFYFLMGLPASGKSAVANQVQQERGARIVDSDIAKELFPEFDNGLGASALHIESSDIAEQLLHESFARGENIIYPGVGKGENTVRRLIGSARKNGYDVHVYFVDLPIEKAMDRVVKRFRQTGRFVSPAYLEAVGSQPRQVFEGIKQESIITSWSDYSNDVPFGSQPRLLARGPEAARRDDRQGLRPEDDSADTRAPGVRSGQGGGAVQLQELPPGPEEGGVTRGQRKTQRTDVQQVAETGNRQGAARPAAASPADRGQMGLGFADEGAGAGSERQAPGRSEGAIQPGGEGDRGRPDERGVLRRAGSRDTGDERGPGPALVVPANYVITPKDEIGGGGDKTKTRNNLAAIRLLKQLTAEKRPATPEEQAALVKYVGWGGLKSVFDERNADTAADRAILKDLLTPSEFEAARRSVLDSHYTSETVVNGIYQGLARLGFDGGRVLEPGMGIGHFFGLMPHSVAEASQLFGVELDPVTGGIAHLLYPRADIKTPRGFQEVNIPSEYFDAAIGNPPFGNQPIADETGAEIPKMSIHNFFFAKALHSLRPGGVLAMVTSHYFLDANNSAARTWMAKRAELIGAIRLPNNAFLKNAGTEVTTDIVFLRKLKAGEKPEASWMKVGSIKDEATGEPIAISPYFIEHPEMMLGKMTLAGTMYGGKLEATLEARPGDDLAKALENAVATLPQGVFQAAPKTVAELAPADVIVPDTVKVGGIFVLPDSRLAVRTPDVMDKPQHQVYQAPNERAIARIKGMIGVRDAVRTLMHAEMADESPEKLARLRSRLNVAYDEFKAKHGYINSLGNRRAFQNDPDLPLLEALERHYDPGVSKDVAKRSGDAPRAPSADKATIFTKRVISPAQIITKADSAGDALSASLSERGKVDLPYMEQLYGKPSEDILKELAGVVFNDPKAGYVTADEYLSGNVKKKLVEAREAVKRDPRMATNVEALERVQPKDVPAVDISVRLGSPWVPGKDVGDFIESLLGERPASISYQASVASWLLDLPERSTSAFTTTWGAKTKAHESWGAGRIIAATLNSKPILVRRNIGTKEAPNWIVLEAETDAARAKGEAIAAKFREWIFQDQSRRDRLARMYNDKFNTDRTREYNGSHLTLPGANPSITLTPNKKHSVWRMIQSKSTLLDHVVGSGKTYTIAAAMMEKRRLGISRKPMVVVPNHIVRQWRDSWYALYPNANILAATEEDFERGNRQRLFARIATGDWDAVIVAHSAFSKIAMPKAERDAVFREQINDISAAIAELKAKKGESYTVRQLERQKLALEDKLKAAEAKTSGKDQFIDFSELGVDDLAVDESQEFKNLFYTSQMRGVTGMGNPEGSGKAFDLFVKTRYLRKRNGKITFATGTPMSNSLVEMYSIQRYLDYDTMRENGLSHLDAWTGTYADIQNVWEVHPSGNGYRLATRFSQFVNLPELVTQYKKFADIITQQDMIDQAKAQGNRYPIPKVRGGKPAMHIAKRSPQQAAFMGVPEFVRDEAGKIQFKRAMNDGDVMSRQDWLKVFSLGEEKDLARWPLDKPGFAIIGGQQQPEDFFATRADAQDNLDAQRNEPKVVYPEGSILWKFENLRELMRESEGKINALSITNEARKAGLDYRIINPKAPDFKGSKVNLAADQITEIWNEWKDDRGTQLVFIDLSTPKGTAKAAPVLDPSDGETVINMDEVMAKASGYSVYDSLREKLIERGIPAREIAFIHDAHTQEQKRKLFAKVNRGEIRVLMGSSFKMGAGTNAQERMVAIHHIDVPWRPSDLEQRDGRGIRQGNDLYMQDPDGFEFQLHRYATEKTYDTRMWQIVQHKASGFEQFRKGAAGARTMEDIGGEASNAGDMKAAASGNPLIAEEIKLRDRLKKLGNIYDAWSSSRYQLENDVERWKKWPAIVAGKVKEIERLIDIREPKPEEGFTLTLADGTKVTDPEGIPTPLVAAMKEAMKLDGALIQIGKYRGFYLSDIYSAWGKVHMIEASTSEKPGATQDRVTTYGEEDKFSPSGFLARVDNYLAGFEKDIERENESAAKSVLELKKAQVELAKPFEQQQEMETTRSKLQEVQAALLKSGGSIEMSPAMQKELASAIKERGGTPPEDTALSRMGELRQGIAGMAQVDVNAVADIYRKGFKGLPPVHVLESVKQAPAELRADIKRLGGENDTAGAWHNGEVYLFSDNITSPMHAEWVILHESTHHGLRGMLGSNLKPLLMDIYLHNESVRKLANDQRSRNPNLSLIAATEEVLANMGADGVPQGVMARIVAAVRKFLRQIGFKLQLSDSDIQGLVAQALRFVKDKPEQTHVLSGTALHPGEADQTKTANFKAWFGKSKVVDAYGKPLVVYHGTNARFNTFTGTKHDIRWEGGRDLKFETMYFSDDEGTAATYGERTVPVYLSLQNPKIIDAHGSKGWADFMPFQKAADAYAKGHDGLIVKNIRDRSDDWIEDGNESTVYIAFRPEQIKSAIGNRGTFSPDTGDIRLSRTAGQPPSAQGTLGLAPASRGLIGHYVNVANKVIDFTDRLSNPLVDLPGQADYLGHRQITMGIIDRGNDIVKMVKAVFKDATPEQRRAAGDYFLTAGARPPAALGAMRIGVENIKKLINEMSDKLVSSGVISAEAREEFRDRYLPQLYLRWLLEDKHWKTIGGKKASDLGYTKERKLIQFRNEQGELKLKEKGTGRVLSDAEVLSLGPVTDPAFLASVAIARSLRDMAILDWLGKISADSRWVLPNSIITWNGKRVSPYFVKEEATRLRKQAEHYQPEDAKRTREYADRMDAAADQAIAGMPESRDGYLQIPKAARYGALRGIWVREEIYHDLMGSSSDMSTDPNWFKDWFGTGGKGETVTRWWKATKTILNLPGQLRNIATNFSQLQLDGIGFHQMPGILAKAVSQMRSNGPYYKEFKQQGGRGGTFSNQELGRMERDLLELQAKAGALSTMQTIHRLAAIVYNAAGDAWQAVEVLGKMMAFVDSRDAGATASKAMARANKVLFDYSLVPSWVRYARRVPFGIAFATWNAKVLPRLVETALKHPHRFLPYAIFYYGAQFALASMLGVGYDDLERLKKAMPEWLANKRHAVLMPWKDEYGRWEVVDLGYIMPWTNWLQLATDVMTGKVTNVMNDIGAFSGPIPNVITAISTSQDPFTHRDIANKGDPPARQAASWLNYAWSMAVPPFLSDTGALGHGIRAYTGQTNKYGDPLDTPTQAALRVFGINRYPLEPDQARAANIRKQEFEIQEVKHAAKMRLMDRAMAPEKRDALIEEYRQEAVRRQEKLVKYISESGIHPALQTGR